MTAGVCYHVLWCLAMQNSTQTRTGQEAPAATTATATTEAAAATEAAAMAAPEATRLFPMARPKMRAAAITAKLATAIATATGTIRACGEAAGEERTGPTKGALTIRSCQHTGRTSRTAAPTTATVTTAPRTTEAARQLTNQAKQQGQAAMPTGKGMAAAGTAEMGQEQVAGTAAAMTCLTAASQLWGRRTLVQALVLAGGAAAASGTLSLCRACLLPAMAVQAVRLCLQQDQAAAAMAAGMKQEQVWSSSS